MTDRGIQARGGFAPIRWLRSRALYPNTYAWFVLAASLDIMLTYVIVYSLGGREVNAIANELLQRFGVGVL